MSSPNFRKQAGLPVGKKDGVKKAKLIEGITNDLVQNTLKQPTKEDFLSFYGEKEEIQSEKLGKLIKTSFLNQFPETLKSEQIHNQYLCKQRKCNDICANEKRNMFKDNKCQHKCLNNPDIACCKATGVWSLCYTETKGMFRAICRIHNVAQLTNRSKIWNTEAVVRCRTETAPGHFKEDILTTMQGQAVKSEQLQQKSYFTVKEKEINKNIDKSSLAVFKALYWVIYQKRSCKAQEQIFIQFNRRVWCKGNRIIFNSFRKTLRGMIVLIGDTIKNKIEQSIRQLKGFAILTDEMTDISNIQQLVIFVQYFDSNIGDLITTFLNTIDVLEHSPDS